MSLPLFPELPEITEVVQDPTAADYAEAARYALKQNQLKLAVQQVAGALVMAPAEPAYRQLLSEVVSRARDPLQLLELKREGVFFGIAAARAWYLASKGKATPAVELLQRVVAFRPNVPLVVWAEEWAARPDFALKVDPSAVAALIRELLQALRTAGPLEGGLQNLTSASALASLVASTHPEHAELRAVRCQMLREAGAAQRALDLALSGAESPDTLAEAALAYQELGRTSERIATLRRAVALAPELPTTHLALGTALIESERLAEAASAFASATHAGGDDSVRAASTYLRWLHDGDRTPLVAFEQSATPLTQRLLRDTRCFDSLLPDPLDPVVRVIRDAVARGRREPIGMTLNAKVRIDGSGAPSALLAYRLALGAIGQLGRITLVGDRRATQLGELWQEVEGGDAAPLLIAFSSESARVVDALARSRFDWATWTASAASAPPCDPNDVLAVAVRPPVPPAHLDAVEWVVRVHTVAGLLLAYHPAPWVERAPAVTRALSATDDWVCGVGIIACAVAAQCDPTLREAAHHALAALLPRPNDPLPFYARVLASFGAALAGAERHRFHALRARIAFSSALA